MHRILVTLTIGLASILLSNSSLAGPFAQTCEGLGSLIAKRACRTVVVIGDTQSMTDHRWTETDYLEKMVDWIIANKTAEHIDFVLQVGDITQYGWMLPASQYCIANNFPIHACADVAEVAEEWERFTTQFDRLEAEGIPFAIVPGNHENIKDGGGQYDGPGFDDIYSPAHLSTLPGYLESRTSTDTGCTATAWEFKLGPEPVLVLGFPDNSLDNRTVANPTAGNTNECEWSGDDDLVDWADDMLAEHSTKKVILLQHRPFSNGHWYTFVDPNPTRYIAAVHGHTATGVSLASPVSEPVLSARIDFTSQGAFDPWVDPYTNPDITGSGNSLMGIIRFALTPGAADQVQAVAWSPKFGVSPYNMPAVTLLSNQSYDASHDRNSDGDATLDDLDFCPYLNMAYSSADADSDGRGDACECGDIVTTTSGTPPNGSVNVNDKSQAHLCPFGSCTPTQVANCDSDNNANCNVSDEIAINIEIFNPNTSTCARSPMAGK